MPKILVIEDNPVEIETIKTRLKQKNYQVLIAKNGEEGIRLAEEEQPDLIFMDMILPGMHGLEATIKLKQNPETKDIPVVALTVMDSSEFVATCFKEGITAFIRKPYDFNEIFEKTEKILGVQESTSKKIMIIDLESSQATMITMHLMRSGYKVISSPNGETGIFEIVEERPDIILLDGSLSRNADYTALKEFKDSDINVTIPFILITQESSPEKIEQEMEKIGADDYIITPFSAKELIEKIEENLQA
ncbi:MAG: response regulator [Candidatus Aminicenantes bacterium]|nr:response regulator [Candidatus Aminicenantes bacterium]MDH5384277.1 response regulator [Candidatus Aminicenantes bacterium]